MGDEISEKAEYIPKHMQDFIFVRELSKVYLLVDHLSGRWDRTLTDGSKDDPMDLYRDRNAAVSHDSFLLNDVEPSTNLYGRSAI